MSPDTLSRFRLAVLVATLSLAGAVPAAGQLVECTGSKVPGLKILLDDIVDAAGGTASPLMQSLLFKLGTNLEQLQLESGLPLTVVPCPKRKPLSPSDFTKLRVEQLHGRQVVLEVWGTTAHATDAAGAKIHEATVGYLLVPVRFEEGEGQPFGAFLLSRQTKSVTSVDDLVRVVDQSGELAAYVAVSTGMRLLKDKKYDAARAQLCRADALLAKVAGQAPAARDKALIAYVRTLAADVVTKAKADGSYEGALKGPLVSAGGCR